MSKSLVAYFRTVWEAAAQLGWCDAVNSAEYWRLRSLWFRQGCPRPIKDWIKKEANKPPSDQGGTGHVRQT